ncbi:MAG: hypothetical protein QF696_12420, partial [Acidimicrobiales bacterium]|nr:hypothetical protein [Acidimicrobiales bacterium]
QANKRRELLIIKDFKELIMIDKVTLQACKDSSIVLELKIKNLEFAVSQSELMISESRVDHEALNYLRKKVASSIQDLEILYMIKRSKKL